MLGKTIRWRIRRQGKIHACQKTSNVLFMVDFSSYVIEPLALIQGQRIYIPQRETLVFMGVRALISQSKCNQAKLTLARLVFLTTRQAFP